MVGVSRLYALTYCGRFDDKRKCDRGLDEGSERDVRRELKECGGDPTTVQVKKKIRAEFRRNMKYHLHATLDFRFSVNLDVDGFPARTSMSSSSESSCR